ncbi:autotransporter domain-containing protein [Methylorubrum populi]
MSVTKARGFGLGLLLASLLSSTALSAERYSTIWNLGDSLSDTGRTYEATGRKYVPGKRQPIGQPYDEGRFSNGRVWVEYLNSDLNRTPYTKGHNLAWGGATAGYYVNAGIGFLIDKFETQNSTLIGSISKKTGFGLLGPQNYKTDASEFGSKPLFTLWIGGNNYRQEVEDTFLGLGKTDKPVKEMKLGKASSQLLDSIPKELNRLSEAVRARSDIAQDGATYYVNTVPNIATTPKITRDHLTIADRLGDEILKTNRQIKDKLYQIQDQFDRNGRSERVVVIDAAALLNEVQARPESFGFKNGRDNCVNADTGQYVGACSAATVDDYLFWDEFHPTTKAHAMIADYAWKTDLLEAGDPVELVRPYIAHIEIRDRTFAGSIGGTGSLLKSGESVLTLAGQNSYSGGTRIDNGTLRIGSDANLGARSGLLTLQGGTLNTTRSFTLNRDVAINASVSKDEIGGSAFGATFRTEPGTMLTLRDNTLSGSGDLAKTGPGTLDIRSSVTEARALTAVQEGTLKINTATDYRTAELTVAKEAVLGGSGTIIGTVRNAGTLSPGNSIGTLTIAGDYEQSGSGRLLMEVDTDRFDALHVNGHLVVGGEIDLAFDPTDKIASQHFTFATSTGSTSGRFGQVIDLNPFLTETLTYESNAVSMTFNRDFTAPAVTANQRAVAQHLNRSYLMQPQGDLDRVFFALDRTETDAAGAAALQALSGEAIGHAATADAVQRGQFVRALEDRMADRRAGRADIQPGIGLDGSWAALDRAGAGQALRAAAAGLTGTAAAIDGVPGGDGLSVWARALGGPGRIGGRGGFDLNQAGVLVGVDKPFDGALFGVSFGYADGSTAGVSSANRAWTSAYQGSVYGSLDLDPVFVDAVAAYTRTDNRTSRGLVFGDLSRTAIGSFGGDDVSAAIKLGTRTRFGAVDAEPSLGLDWYRLSRDGFSERNAGSAGLFSRPETQDIVQPSVGLRVSAAFLYEGILISPELRGRYYRNLGDTVSPVTASLIGAPGAPFTTHFPGIGRDTGVISVGLTAQKATVQVFARYEAAIGSNLTAHLFAGGLRYAW